MYLALEHYIIDKSTGVTNINKFTLNHLQNKNLLITELQLIFDQNLCELKAKVQELVIKTHIVQPLNIIIHIIILYIIIILLLINVIYVLIL